MISCLVLTHNRLPFLRQCLDAIFKRTQNEFEVIVVNNASTDGTEGYLLGLQTIYHNLFVINNKENLGVVARNLGIDLAKGDYIAQIDDDVIVFNEWNIKVLNQFKDMEPIGAVGQQGGIIDEWLSTAVYKNNNGYVDFLTGFFWVFKKVGLKYDEAFGKFWHEELDLSLQFKAEGYKLKILPQPVCSHHSLRVGKIDWELHNRNLDYVRTKWKDKIKELNLEFLKE